MNIKTALKRIALPMLLLPVALLFCSPAFAQQQLPPVRTGVSVNALVPPTVADFQFNFQYIGPSLVHQDQVITYEVTYGASSSAGLSTSNTVVVNYSSDKAPDKSFLIDYVFGSASKGYGGVQPVVDTKDRTITWAMGPLPEGTMNQKLRFQLRANGHTHDLKRLTFRSKAVMRNEYVTLPDYGVQQDYLFDPTLVTPGPTATPGPQDIPTPTPTASQLRFFDISLSAVSQSQASIDILTNKPTRKTIRYGTTPTALTQQTQSSNTAQLHTVVLPNLTPNTDYFYQVTAVDAAGKTIRSDILTFTTAKESPTIQAGRDAFTLTSGDLVLRSDILLENAEASGFVLLPVNTPYNLTYTFAVPPSSQLHEVLVRNEQGVMQRVQMNAVDERTFTASLRTNSIGAYTISIVQADDKGNVISRRLADLRVTPQFRVIESMSGAPLSDARVVLQKFNPSSKQYEDFETNQIKNPSFTNAQGEAAMVLTQGRYKVVVTAFGYREKAVEFVIGNEEGTGYPTVPMERDLFNANALLTYLRTMAVDTFTYVTAAIRTFSESIRVFAVTSVVTLGSFVTVGFMLFNIRTDIRWKDFLPFFIFRLAAFRGKHAEMYLFGIVVDKDGKLLNEVRLEFTHVKTGVVLAHTMSNQSGGFRVSNTFEEPYVKLVASKEGMPPLAMIVATDTKNAITVKLRENKHAQRDSFFAGIKHLTGGFFELVLILSLILELLFIEAFGVARTLPFILLTFFNLALWIFYQKERDLHKGS